MTLLRRQHAAAPVALLLSGCGLFLEGPKPDASTGQADANLDAAVNLTDASMDAPTVPDSFIADAPVLDAPTLDALALDATPDAFMPPMCVPQLEVCNAVDDDCDGPVDEAPLDCRVIGGVMCQRIETPHGLYLLCNGARSRESARTFCESVTMFGGSFGLVSLEARAEAEALHLAIGPRAEAAWIGMTRVPGSPLLPGQFQWDSGATFADPETSWAPGEPNNRASPKPGVEDCVEVFLNRPPTFMDGNWNDVGCAGHPTMFICEESP